MGKKSIYDLKETDLLSAIKLTSEQEGFFLEQQVANIVKNNFKDIKLIATNATFDEDRNDDFSRRSLDVLALGQTTSEASSLKLLTCEVKAGGKNSKLILIKKKFHDIYDQPNKIQGYQFGDRYEGLNIANAFVTQVVESSEPIYCHTGDFYKWHEHDEMFKKSNTSLYKATEQLFHGIEGFLSNQNIDHWEDDLIGATLIPIIVTNVDIYVAQNEGATTATKVNFAILENTIRFRNLEIDSDPHGNFINKVFPYCWIVNVEVLSDFIKKPFSFNQGKPVLWK